MDCPRRAAAPRMILKPPQTSLRGPIPIADRAATRTRHDPKVLRMLNLLKDNHLSMAILTKPAARADGVSHERLGAALTLDLVGGCLADRDRRRLVDRRLISVEGFVVVAHTTLPGRLSVAVQVFQQAAQPYQITRLASNTGPSVQHNAYRHPLALDSSATRTTQD